MLNELGLGVSFIASVTLLGAAVPDDDKDNPLYNIATYVSKGVAKELLGLYPLPSLEYGWIDTGFNRYSNPFAATGTLTNIIKLIARSVDYALGNDSAYFKSGPNKGTVKALDSAQRLIPALNQYRRLMRLADKGANKVHQGFQY